MIDMNFYVFCFPHAIKPSIIKNDLFYSTNKCSYNLLCTHLPFAVYMLILATQLFKGLKKRSQ